MSQESLQDVQSTSQLDVEITVEAAKQTEDQPNMHEQASNSVSVCNKFQVESEIKLGGEYRRRGHGLEQAWTTCFGGQVEAMSSALPGAKVFFDNQNLFAKCINDAFYGHFPLRLSPDVVWMTIVQGLANHVALNAETLREKFVDFQNKKTLLVSRPDFVKGCASNDWESVFPEFAAKIKASAVEGIGQLLQADFSTTTVTDNVVSCIALMDTVQHYFTYEMACGCGFPSIELTGTPGDWERVRAKAEKLHAFDLDFWLAALLPVLDEFVQAAHKRPNLAFWRSLVSSTGPSGMPGAPLTGWVQAFFPYLNPVSYGRYDKSDNKQMNLVKNSSLTNYLESMKNNVTVSNAAGNRGLLRCGTNIERIPPGISQAPVLYKDAHTGREYNMAFCGGITSIVQHDDNTIEPRIGWAVIDLGEVSH